MIMEAVRSGNSSEVASAGWRDDSSTENDRGSEAATSELVEGATGTGFTGVFADKETDSSAGDATDGFGVATGLDATFTD